METRRPQRSRWTIEPLVLIGVGAAFVAPDNDQMIAVLLAAMVGAGSLAAAVSLRAGEGGFAGAVYAVYAWLGFTLKDVFC